MPDSHMYGENGVEIMVYNVKKHSKTGVTEEKQKRKKGRKNTTVKRKNSKLLITLLGYNRGCFLYFCKCNSTP